MPQNRTWPTFVDGGRNLITTLINRYSLQLVVLGVIRVVAAVKTTAMNRDSQRENISSIKQQSERYKAPKLTLFCGGAHFRSLTIVSRT